MVRQQNRGQIQLLQLSSVESRICEEIRYQPIPKGTAQHWIPGSYKGTPLPIQARTHKNNSYSMEQSITTDAARTWQRLTLLAITFPVTDKTVVTKDKSCEFGPWFVCYSHTIIIDSNAQTKKKMLYHSKSIAHKNRNGGRIHSLPRGTMTQGRRAPQSQITNDFCINSRYKQK